LASSVTAASMARRCFDVSGAVSSTTTRAAAEVTEPSTHAANSCGKSDVRVSAKTTWWVTVTGLTRRANANSPHRMLARRINRSPIGQIQVAASLHEPVDRHQLPGLH
jgi:hypothetical protein